MPNSRVGEDGTMALEEGLTATLFTTCCCEQLRANGSYNTNELAGFVWWTLDRRYGLLE